MEIGGEAPSSVDKTMEESVPPNPNCFVPPSPADPPPPPLLLLESPSPTCQGLSFPRPAIRVTSEFDSDSFVFFHKVSCKVLDGLAKLKLTFQNNDRGEVSDPQVALASKNLSLHYDLQDQNALVKGSFDVSDKFQFRASHDVKAQQGELAMVANLGDPKYKFELASAVPIVGLPRATFKFPQGEISLEEKEEEEVKRILSMNGIVKSELLNGICTAQYKDENLNLRYSFKDKEMTFTPSITLPSNSLSFAFKRQLNISDKLSYWYNFDSKYWSTVYKHKASKDCKVKVGYDSEVGLGWASIWFGGDEGGRAKEAPMKLKAQVMLQVPQDDINSSVLMFRLKKRWDI